MSRRSAEATDKRLEVRFRKLGKNIDDLIEGTKRAEAAARTRYASQLKTLKARQEQIRRILARLGRRSAAASGPLKAGARKVWAELTEAVREATRRYRETS